MDKRNTKYQKDPRLLSERLGFVKASYSTGHLRTSNEEE